MTIRTLRSALVVFLALGTWTCGGGKKDDAGQTDGAVADGGQPDVGGDAATPLDTGPDGGSPPTDSGSDASDGGADGSIPPSDGGADGSSPPSDGGSDASDGGAGSEVIGPSGGTVTSADGKLHLQVPPGALSKGVVISVTPLVPDDKLPVGTLAAVKLEPSGQEFTEPVTITMSYLPALIPDGDSESDLCIGQLIDDAWVVSQGMGQCLVDTSAKTVTTTTTHFSTFGIYPPGKTLTVTTAGSGDGSVELTPFGIAPPEFVCLLSTCVRTYVHGTIVILKAVPDGSSTFGGWSGNCAGTAAETYVELTASQSCVATFVGMSSDPCLPNPCQHGGTCTNNGGVQCACPFGFGGALCEKTCTILTANVNYLTTFAPTVSRSDGFKATMSALGGAQVQGSAATGVGIVGGISDATIDPGEYLDFSFSQPVTNIQIHAAGGVERNTAPCCQYRLELFKGFNMYLVDTNTLGAVNTSALPAMTPTTKVVFARIGGIDSTYYRSMSYDYESCP